LQDFETRPLAESISQAHDGARLWIFVHIPKTAGSSLSHALARHAAPYRNIHPEPIDDGFPHLQKIARAVDRFLDDRKTIGYLSCSGHIRRDDFRRIAEAADGARLVTFLRDPVDRVISDFRYSRTPEHPEWREVIATYPTIETYVEDSRTQDKMWRFLVGDRRGPLDAGIAQVESGFAFVGTVEDYPLSFGVLFRMITNADVEPGPRVRLTETTEHNQVQVTPELRRRIEELNPRDLALYRHFSGKLATKREAWRAMRGAPAASENAAEPSFGAS